MLPSVTRFNASQFKSRDKYGIIFLNHISHLTIKAYPFNIPLQEEQVTYLKNSQISQVFLTHYNTLLTRIQSLALIPETLQSTPEKGSSKGQVGESSDRHIPQSAISHTTTKHAAHFHLHTSKPNYSLEISLSNICTAK